MTTTDIPQHQICGPKSLIDRVIAGEELLELTREEFANAEGEWVAISVPEKVAQRWAAVGSQSGELWPA
ncbi:hypothetical protein [Mycobacteroides abscessus]|uniref:hypothetical protein n=1 Tax=Mycobacteroides abscessus TaxID=36809 RepID=UPI00092AECE4|nr:hypothetical protein [Mycobacteroides abscessus]DAZ90322.1 TPA_asm: hypothetical protein PROPHIFSQJ01-1_36 [Mycobacterium phage prophiFSQJ01-1]SII40791.1 Uncharacterised protein [Mycobacteroides abscessus subsp. abscessus]SIK14422.1 Uncharacterised protein [Mycobacteroides abscessus subsp. abscessus]SIN25252.1 Uncharacterised protein [Mycobacteroides abscessus subsp. abscessus]SLI51674.1 Uncharacterised protein [Mycobacteroides abscessus subsp. abscessus]